MQYVHSYQELAKKKIVPSIESLLGDSSEYPELLLPELNENDEVIFKYISNHNKIIPGLNTIETIITLVNLHKDLLSNE